VSTLHRLLDERVSYPAHPPRKDSPTYARTHKHLIYDLDAPCWVCAIRHSQGGAMETHHAHFEWASQNGLDLEKVTMDWPEITDRAKLAEWVDSEQNMLCLCAAHHRCSFRGIHSISYPAWLLQRYQGEAFTFIDQSPTARVPLNASGAAAHI
jgi:hypothetical protein